MKPTKASICRTFYHDRHKSDMCLDEKELTKFLRHVVVEENTGCWLWDGTKSGLYGQFTVHGKQTGAHRVSWMLKHGESIPVGMCICHVCDTPSCVNPDHLFLGTYKDNGQDMGRKIKQRKGETRNPEKFKKEEILEIRAARIRGVDWWEIAEAHKITPAQVNEIFLREDWPWLQ
jgi:hypothetical protein